MRFVAAPVVRRFVEIVMIMIRPTWLTTATLTSWQHFEFLLRVLLMIVMSTSTSSDSGGSMSSVVNGFVFPQHRRATTVSMPRRQSRTTTIATTTAATAASTLPWFPLLHPQHRYYSTSLQSLSSQNESYMGTSNLTTSTREDSTRMASTTSTELNGLANDEHLNGNWQKEEEDQDEQEEQTFVWTQQWYPIIPAEYARGLDLEKKPFAFKMLDQKLVLWKSQQHDNDSNSKNCQYSVLLDTCPHRRAPLSTGKVVTAKTPAGSSSSSSSSSSSLACRYHGWEFNAQGTCTAIPMDPASNSAAKTAPTTAAAEAGAKFSRIRVPSYPVQEAGGVLWVFMDPYYEERDHIPEIPPHSLMPQEELESGPVIWLCSETPVSYLSMLENSMDPSHAPFVHEGIVSPGRGLIYSPQNAQPMEIYRLTTALSATRGFSLEHSPYMKMKPPNKEGVEINDTASSAPLPLIIRQFIPPITTVVVSPPAFTARLYFVPNTPTTTTTIGYFQIPSNPLLKRLTKLQQLLVPKSWRQTIANWIHVAYLLSDGQMRFNKQDSWTMQGQDERKRTDLSQQQQRRGGGGGGRGWDDMVVSTSDAGIMALQRWMRKFGNGGPFTLHNLLQRHSVTTSTTAGGEAVTAPSFASSSAVSSASRVGPTFRSMSVWESHAKMCPQCQAVLKQASNWERRFRKGAKLTLAWSAVSTLWSCGGVGGWMMRRHATSYTAAWSILPLILAVTLRSWSDQCRRLQERFFTDGHDDWRNHRMEFVYHYD